MYPRFDFLSHLMESGNRILQWNARRILGHLASVDSEGRIEQLLDRYLAPVTGHEMISPANAIQALPI